ncbi:MAG: BMP family protein [Nitrospinota bacterium]|nr:BMP family protein [Nitrospinota bacterium]
MIYRKVLGMFSVCFLAMALAAGLLAGPAAGAKKIRVALGNDGPQNDMGWYEGGYRAALKLKTDPGVDEVSTQERVKVADMERALRRWAVAGYNLIFGHGYDWGAPAMKVAKDFPNTIFAVAGFFQTKGRPNVITYLVQSHETGYLSGMLATLMSKTNKIGVIGGFPIPQQIAEHNGYILGARSVNSNVKVSSIFINDWMDASKAKEAAIAMIDQGVDVVKVTASPMGFGGIKGAEEKGKYAIGTYMDLNRMAPDTVLSSTLFIWHAAMKKLVLDMKKGKVKKQYLVNVPDGGSAMAPFNKKVPPKVANRVRAAERDIKSGKLKVPFLGKKVMK